MNPLENLTQYLDRLERRLRLFAWTRGAAAVLGLALGLTLVIVAALIWGAFSHTGVLVGRFILFLGIGGAIAVMLIAPLLRLNRRRAAQEVERRQPGFDQRLLTFTEKQRDNPGDPFLPLLADDALTMARDHQPEQIVNTKYFVRFASIGAAAAGVLLWLAFWGPGVLGYGTALLWGSLPKGQSTRAYFSVSVDPGSKTIRRHSDQTITAHLNGFVASKASLWVQYASAPKWEEAPMISDNGAFTLPLIAVPEDVQYYVRAGSVRSDTFKLHTIDLPGVKNIHVTYNYPSWTGIPTSIEDPGGDLRAIEGTVAKLDITTDRPLSGAQLIIENDKTLNIPATTDNHTTIDVPIEKDGTYHIAVTDHGESVRLTDDYFIEARKVGAPTLSITRPGRDAKVSPIEEVKVSVSSQDEFPLQELDFHYSVNGAQEKVINLLSQKGVKQAEGNTMLSFEDFKLVPGDIVSIYATARDGKNLTKTDMYFIEAVPFEYSYSQSQQMGGGGGGGADQQEQQISEREKEIIAATFNQLKGDAKAKAAAAENGKYLADIQAKLRDQAESLANRTKARQLDGSGAGFQQFVKEMEAAVASMTPASDKLKSLSFQDALTPEQQALQHLLRAESTFRDIQIQISRGGGGGGGGGGAGRDLANLFDLELDKDKNQFETNASSQAEQKQQQIDDTLKKLEELARRQQELAQQQQNQQSLAQQRYQQEMLRREAEELKRQMEQLQRGDQNQQGQQGQQGQPGQQGQQSANGQQGSQQGQQGSQGSQSNSQQARSGNAGQSASQNQQNGLNRAQSQQLDQAIKSLEQAERSMGDSASARQPGQQNQQQQGQGQSQADAQRAAEQLRQAGQNMAQLRQQQTGSELGTVANKAEQLAGQQQDFEQRLRRGFGQGEGSRSLAQQMAEEQQKMLDSYNQLQKDMLQASRDAAGADPNTAKQLRDAMGRSQEADLGTKMESTENMLRQGLGQYAVMREAPVTRSLNDLRDQLRQIEQQSAKNGAGAGGDQAAIATEQALNRAESIRRQMEQLARTAQQRGQGNQPGQQPGNNGNGQKPGQQPGSQGSQQGQQASNQPGQGQQGQQGQGQGQGQGQQPGQGQGQGQQAGNGAQGGGGSYGGGGGLNTSPRGGVGGPYAGTPYAPNFGDRNPGDGNWNTNGPVYQNQQDADAAYNEMLRDLNRLRGEIADDKGLAAEYADLMRRAQEMDPRHMNNDPRLSTVINGQALSELDEVELMLRRKLEATAGSVRSTAPRNTPPGYADAVAEYYKRLSKQ